MILIQDILVSDALIHEQFVCHLERCKGACCIEGDYGAPLDPGEKAVLEKELTHIRPFMEAAGIAAVEAQGVSAKFGEEEAEGVTLRSDGACAFVRIDAHGIASCAIEKAWSDGATEFRKPISCHLYPVRIGSGGALNYEQWNICSPACSLGKAEKVPLYSFVREALIRKYGEEFYQTLEDTATQGHK